MEKNGRKILLAMDGSDDSDHAYRWYLKFFRQKDDYVIFVHCPEMSQLQLSCFFTKSTEEIKDMMLHEENETKLLLARLNEHLKREGISGKTIRLDGDPREALTEIAEKENIDCIITGSRGVNRKRSTIIGSVSSYLVHHSKVPVMIVKKDK